MVISLSARDKEAARNRFAFRGYANMRDKNCTSLTYHIYLVKSGSTTKRLTTENKTLIWRVLRVIWCALLPKVIFFGLLFNTSICAAFCL